MHDQLFKNITLLVAKIGTLAVYLAEASRWILGVKINDVLTVLLTTILIIYWAIRTFYMVRSKRDKNRDDKK